MLSLSELRNAQPSPRQSASAADRRIERATKCASKIRVTAVTELFRLCDCCAEQRAPSHLLQIFLSQPHLRHLIRDRQLSLSGRDHLLNRDAGSCFQKRCATADVFNDGHFADNEIDWPGGSQWQRAFVDNLRLTLGSVLHCDNYALAARDQVHRPS